VPRLIEDSGVDLKKTGKDLAGCCPQHEDGTARDRNHHSHEHPGNPNRALKARKQRFLTTVHNTRLSSGAQLMRAGRACAQPDFVAAAPRRAGVLVLPCGYHQCPQLGIGRQHAVEANEVQPQSRHGCLKGALRSSGQPGAA